MRTPDPPADPGRGVFLQEGKERLRAELMQKGLRRAFRSFSAGANDHVHSVARARELLAAIRLSDVKFGSATSGASPQVAAYAVVRSSNAAVDFWGPAEETSYADNLVTVPRGENETSGNTRISLLSRRTGYCGSPDDLEFPTFSFSYIHLAKAASERTRQANIPSGRAKFT